MVIDVLMNIGVPAGIKGFTYICDAIELFNTDPYYPDGKISALYIDIAKKYHTTPSRVERSIRHAFDIALTKGDPDMVSRYLGSDKQTELHAIADTLSSNRARTPQTSGRTASSAMQPTNLYLTDL